MSEVDETVRWHTKYPETKETTAGTRVRRVGDPGDETLTCLALGSHQAPHLKTDDLEFSGAIFYF
jgi:hypothetical protein